MEDLLACSELFEGIPREFQEQLFALASRQSLAKGDYVFRLGEHARRLDVVLQGKVETCFPLSIGGVVKDVPVEVLEAGRSFGLSALVNPYRFTLSARAAAPTELAAFARADLLRLAEVEPRIGVAFMSRLADVLGRRFLTMRTLWAREMQRCISSGGPAASDSPSH